MKLLVTEQHRQRSVQCSPYDCLAAEALKDVLKDEFYPAVTHDSTSIISHTTMMGRTCITIQVGGKCATLQNPPALTELARAFDRGDKINFPVEIELDIPAEFVK